MSLRRILLQVALLFIPVSVHAASDFFQLLELGEFKTAEKLIPSLGANSQVTQKYLAAQIAFHRHQYGEALGLLNDLPRSKEVEEFKSLLASTIEATKTMLPLKTEHFDLYYTPGKDEILALYAKDVVEQIRTAIARDLNVAAPERVRVEFYPTWKAFMSVSTLSEEEVKTSGTIALCKFNRLLLTTPRSLLKGYEWLDTLTHEFAHAMINRASQGRAPVWIHEGLAKYEEVRWRLASGSQISPGSSGLLARRLKKGSLIPFEKLHPSIAKLPSQEDAELAFAQVYYFFDFLISKKGGMENIQKLLAQIATGKGVEAAFLQTYGSNLAQLHAAWLIWLQEQPLQAGAKARIRQKELKDNPESKLNLEDADIGRLGNPKIKNLVRIGDRLMSKQRWKAALTEYEKAKDLSPEPSSVVFNKIALASIELQDWDRSLRAISDAIEREPGNVTSYVRRGLVHYRKKELDLAEKDFLYANSINPFDPQIHSALRSIYSLTKRSALEEREKMVSKILEP